jgi:hypothetical protein
MLRRLPALAAVVFLLSGCDALAPIFGGSIEIRGPRYAVATRSEPLFGAGGARFRCVHPLTLGAFGSSQSDSRIEWIAAEVLYREPGGREALWTDSWGTDEVRQRMPWVSPGYESQVRWEVEADFAPFDWTLRLHYYSTADRRTRIAEFSASCRAPGQR